MTSTHRHAWRTAATLVAAVALTGLVVLGWPAPASAHGGVLVAVHSDGAGSVWATVAWEDGHPVTEGVAATLLATSDAGDRVGPALLTSLRDQFGTLTYAGTLTTGRWRVVVDVASPGLGHCEGTFVVGPPASAAPPSSVDCAPSPSPTPPAAAAPPGGRPVGILVGIGAAAAITVAAALFLLRRRPPATPRRRR